MKPIKIINNGDKMVTLRPSAVIIAFLITIILLLGACTSAGTSNQPEATQLPTQTPVPATATPLPPTATSTPTITPSQTPTFTATATHTATASATPTDEPTPTDTATATTAPQAVASSNVLVKYLVHAGTGGSTGCGDSLVPVSTGFLPTGDIEEDVKIALNSLFSTGTKYVGNLYNPLYQSNLRVGKVEFKKSTGELTIYLNGGFKKPKDECDKKLYRAQVWDTARQFPEVWRAYIWVNDKYLLGDLLVVGDS
jgi:hypothetical protein